ncbi:MAG: hypothetical protein OEW23_16090 [Candidatus Aminicenantes bacterium]|nr:hypothetical protein [Candidatus Aminicenantes bacterium]
MRKIILVGFLVMIFMAFSSIDSQRGKSLMGIMEKAPSRFLIESHEWARVYRGPGMDRSSSICQAVDGGYIAVGGYEHREQPRGQAKGQDLWVLKLGSDGDIEWQKVYGGSDYSGFDWAESILQTEEGGYVIAGQLVTYDDVDAFRRDFWVLKVTSTGEVEWQKIYAVDEAPIDPFDENIASCIIQTKNGDFIVGGHTHTLGEGWIGSTNIWLLKLNINGEIVWQKTYGGLESEYYYTSDSYIKETSDGGYIVGAHTRSYGGGSLDLWILKLDADGDVEWQKTYGGWGSEQAYSILETDEGGYIVAGTSNSFGEGYKDIWIIRLTDQGKIKWQKRYGGNNHDDWYDKPMILQTESGGYIVASLYSRLGEGERNILILKLIATGDVQWQKTIKGIAFFARISFKPTTDGGYILATETETYGDGLRDFLILKLTASGEIGPSCVLMGIVTGIIVADTSISPKDTDMIPIETNIVPKNSNAVPQDTNVDTEVLCWDLHQPPASISLTVLENRSLFRKENWHLIEWSQNSWNNPFEITEYRIYRREKGFPSSGYQHVAKIPSSTLEYRDGPFDGSKIYEYSMSSVDASGRESPMSTPVNN